MLILGRHCQNNKGLGFTLQSVFGVNHTTGEQICAMLGVRKNVKLSLLKPGRLEKLKKLCRDHIPSGLDRKMKANIKHLINIKHYRGVRHMFSLPARGQRTRTNASTSKRLGVVKHLNSSKRKWRPYQHPAAQRRPRGGKAR